MWLRHLSILNFKNIAEGELDLCRGLNCLLGDNGMGKSNLLEAIHFLSFTRPMRSVSETSLVRHDTTEMMVKGTYDTGHPNDDTVACSIVKGKGKRVRLNGKEYERISQHIGRFPVVTVAPDDSDIIRGPAQERRRLMDMVISQTDAAYLATLMTYTRALTSRNSMLRAGVRDKLLFESVEAQMCNAAAVVHATRTRWAEAIEPLFAGHYAAIAADGEVAVTGYRSVLQQAPLQDILDMNRQRDTALGYTSAGVHRDDLVMQLGEHNMRHLGSQGQMKTFTIAMRLAIFDYVRRQTGLTPILLLDDIYDKLDSDRVGRIMQLVSDRDRFGQIVITDTNRRHLDTTVSATGAECRMWRVSDGCFTPIEIAKR